MNASYKVPLAIICIAGLLLAFNYNSVRAALSNMYEDVAYAVSPTAARAYAYGVAHFDAANPAQYDINRASYFFNLAVAKDPTLPYIYHELARIAFLRGNFNQALALIDIQIERQGDKTPNSYYVRGLIEGYMGLYDASAKDYEHFIRFDPHDWAAKNDEAWVLLKAKRYADALAVTDSGLADDPANPWLLNSNATALYELGRYREALAVAEKASAAVALLTPAQWSHAYPGNDPAIAAQGLATFQKAVRDNMHTISLAVASSTVQSKSRL